MSTQGKCDRPVLFFPALSARLDHRQWIFTGLRKQEKGNTAHTLPSYGAAGVGGQSDSLMPRNTMRRGIRATVILIVQ